MRHAELVPVHAIVEVRATKVREEAVAQLLHRHEGRAGHGFEQPAGRRVAQEVERVVHERQRRLAGEPHRVRDRTQLAVGELDALGEGQFLGTVLQVRRQLDHLAVIHDGLGPALHQQPAVMAPAGDPLEQFQALQHEVAVLVLAMAVALHDPLDELPVERGKQLLLVRGAGVEVNQVSQRFLLLTSARTKQVEFDGELVQRRVLHQRLRLADDPQAGARGVEMDGGGREEPVLQLLHQLALLLRLLDLGEARVIGELLQLLRQRASGAEEQDGQFLEPGTALGVHHARPPFVRAKVLAREVQLLEVILEQQPGALRVRAGGEEVEQVAALRHFLLGIGQFPTQVS